jgi:subtilase family serine protease
VDDETLAEGATDAEWAHVTAPGADILFVEASVTSSGASAALDDQAIDTAVNDGASVVSMSWSDPTMSSADNSHFEVSTTGFVSGLGGFGCPDETPYPAASTYVLSVGGTDLNSAMTSEPAWSKTGGYVNPTETRPAYQEGWTKNIGRTDNDVAYDAVNYSIYRVEDGKKGWQGFRGVSVGIPQWAGLIADADQARAALGKSVLASSGLLDGIYLAANSNEPKKAVINPAMFKDVTSGSGGSSAACSAKSGFDEATGLGVPQANGLVPELANL